MSTSIAPVAERALDVAAAIGFGLARKAIWSGERCSWLDGVPVAPGQNPAVSMMCGADVYGGTAGIGWFLAQAAARIPDALLARTARGALRQAAARAGAIGIAPQGLYGGAPGVGAALVVAGGQLGDEEAVSAGRALLMTIPAATEDPMATDLVSGMAGTVLAFAMASAALGGDRALLDRAGQAAERLLAMGARDAHGGLSWPSMPDCRANLTGFAHGAAGIAHALLVLDALAPDPRLAEAAAAAFAYESAVYDPARRNWPDFRILPGQPQDQVFFPVAWCHGAAGIVRSRLAAAARGIDVAADVEAGIGTTAAEVERWAHMPGADFTLCHGLFGLADALLDSTRAGQADHGALVTAIAEHSAVAFHDGERPWPSGLPTREELNGLMMGNAGIGHFYLRLADPALESVLAPGAGVRRR
jgi:lantibiotic modifying enzyme